MLWIILAIGMIGFFAAIIGALLFVGSLFLPILRARRWTYLIITIIGVVVFVASGVEVTL